MHIRDLRMDFFTIQKNLSLYIALSRMGLDRDKIYKLEDLNKKYRRLKEQFSQFEVINFKNEGAENSKLIVDMVKVLNKLVKAVEEVKATDFFSGGEQHTQDSLLEGLNDMIDKLMQFNNLERGKYPFI